MKIVKLKNKHQKRVSATCRHCGTTVETQEDKLKWEHDRDGRLARETCPNESCGAAIFFY
jgi:hypothetical protein